MKNIITLLALCISVSTIAKVSLPALFSDNMVLQQNTKVKVWGWSEPKKDITVRVSWSGETFNTQADKKGNWSLYIPTSEAGGPYEMVISDGEEETLSNILLGEVWLCAGQSNMEMPMKGFRGQPVKGSNLDILKSSNDNIRFISVPRSKKTIPQDNFNGEWKSASPASIRDFSATAYYYARLLQEILDIPVGLVEVSYGGSCVEAWTSRENANSFGETEVPAVKDSIKLDQRTPTVLFNGMLHPVIGYTVQGAIWYQGESNYNNSEYYAERFATMVKEWRDLWGQGDFPFYYMQIAPFDYSVFNTPDTYKEKYNSAYLREAQLKALDLIPNANMAVALDLGDKKSIHPMDKKTGGERLAYIALAEQYGVKGIGYLPPKVKGTEIVNSTMVISFDNIPNGITSFGKEVTTFEVAGEDEHFYPATAWVRSKSVVISSPRVKKPVAVRYAFKDYVEAQLFSNEGIPVPSFRTDEW